MKHNHNMGPKILIFSAAVPLLIFTCLATGLIAYLAFNLDVGAGRISRDSGTVRIRTIPELAPASPTLVTTEPAQSVERPALAEVPAETVLSEPALIGPANEAETSSGSSPAEETKMVIETASVQNEPPVVETTPVDTAAVKKSSTVLPQPEVSVPPENLPRVEVPVAPVPPEQTLPDLAANPLPPQNKLPVQTVPSEPSFVPDSSFFDQLLDQVD